MSIFYIQYTLEGVTGNLALTSTRTVTRTSKQVLTDNIVENGSEVTDHYVVGRQTVKFDGVVTDIRSTNAGDAVKTPETYLSLLEAIRDSKTPFTVFTGEVTKKAGAIVTGSFNALENCLFETFSVTQDKRNGTVRSEGNLSLSSYRINFSAKQIRLTPRAGTQDITIVSPEYALRLQGQDIASAATKEPTEAEKVNARLPTLRSL